MDNQALKRSILRLQQFILTDLCEKHINVIKKWYPSSHLGGIMATQNGHGQKSAILFRSKHFIDKIRWKEMNY